VVKQQMSSRSVRRVNANDVSKHLNKLHKELKDCITSDLYHGFKDRVERGQELEKLCWDVKVVFDEYLESLHDSISNLFLDNGCNDEIKFSVLNLLNKVQIDEEKSEIQ
jgi:hypothetical protein